MNRSGSSLANLFPDGDYRFHLTLRRGDPGAFFRPQDLTGRLLAERARWLAAEPGRYAAMQAEGIPLLEEFSSLVAEWGASIPALSESAPAVDRDDRSSAIHVMGAALEPDLLLLSPDANGQFRLRGGALCFPTGWALEEKIGHTLEFIHGVVPGLNAALAASIQQFLSKLKPGVAFLRDNWGLTASDELNLHPARRIRAPAPPIAFDRLWLRVEHQALIALPHAGGIAFGIRIELHRLDRVVQSAAGPLLRRALATMPAEMIVYKGLGEVYPQIMGNL